MKIASLREPDVQSSAPILQLLNIFTPDVYICLVILSVLFGSILWKSIQLEGASKTTLSRYIVFLFEVILNQNSAKFYDKRMLILILTLSSMLLSINFLTRMSTDLMVERQTFRIDSLEDLLSPEGRKFRPMLRETNPIISRPENMLTERELRLRMRIKSYGIERCILGLKHDQFLSYFDNFERDPIVVILSSVASSFCKKVTFSSFLKNRLPKNLYAYLSKYSVSNSVYAYLDATEPGIKRLFFRER